MGIWLIRSYTILLLTELNLATNRVASVDSLLIRQGVGGRRSWDVRFIRVPNDWEMEMVMISFGSWLPIYLLWMKGIV